MRIEPITAGWNRAARISADQEQNFSADVEEAWVRHYASGLAAGDDVATAMAVDDSGNIYVTGYSTNKPFGFNYFTVKYNNSGAQVWTARCHGEGEGDDLAFAICVDAPGNVYVTGKSLGLGTSYDYLTIKYNGAGVEQWIARYNGPENLTDEAVAIAVDESGNVYVTGSSVGSGGFLDYATIKYDSFGEQEWVVRYDGPSNLNDLAKALAIDKMGNVYVTGSSEGGYATVKYNSPGEVQWVAQYSFAETSYDIATDIAVDLLGNVYVTGRSAEEPGQPPDYATVKYTPSGVEEWVARYNGTDNLRDWATALAIDDSGNVYVTGWSEGIGTGGDYATIKYNSSGEEQWVARYDGPIHRWDSATAIAADGSGNVYVTGYSYGPYGSGTSRDYALVKYNASGVEEWVTRYNSSGNFQDEATALVVDNSGNIYVTGKSAVSVNYPVTNDYATIKYNSAGMEQWVTRYDGPGNSRENATALAIDDLGNVYVTGTSESRETGRDYVTIKYNPTGVEQWIAKYNGPVNSQDETKALALDGSGNVYVTGASLGQDTDFDYATLKYNNAGVEQWVVRYDGPDNAKDFATAIEVDNSGNVYVTGASGGYFATIKYDNAGVEQWVARSSFSGGSIGIEVDRSGNIYVFGDGFVIIKYNHTGVEQWVARYNGPGLLEATALTVDGTNNVYITGWRRLSHMAADYVTVSFDSSGVQRWVAIDNNSCWDKATALVLDDAGNVLVTGGNQVFYFTIKYDNAGVRQWVVRYNDGGGLPTSLATDKLGNVYVTGSSGSDYVTIKYTADGVEQWVVRYDSPRPSYDNPIALSVDDSGNVYVTGTSKDTNNNWTIYTTIKYIQATPVAVEEKGSEIPQKFHLAQNYPNPFNPSTTIRFSVPSATEVTLQIFDVRGREIETLIRSKLEPGEYTVQWNASGLATGVYFYRLQAGDLSVGSPNKSEYFIETRKLILLK